jgi:tetratricopeptide (TPR) repeat protein
MAAGVVGIGLVVFLLVGREGSSAAGERLAEADGLLSAGQYQQADVIYSQLLADDEDFAPAYRGRGRARLAAGEVEAGLGDLARAVEISRSPDVMEELAGALFDRGRFEEAAARFEEAIKKGGDTGETRYHLAACLHQLGRGNEALSHLEVALAKDAKLAEARYLYGKLLNLHSRHAEAEQELRKAEAGIQMRGEYYAELGVALLEQGKVEEAEIVARDFARFDANDARAHSLLGEVFLRKKQLEPAREELIKALTSNPTEPRAQIALGRTWLALGDPAKARQILTGAKGVPEGERLLVLGQVTLAEGKTEEAIATFERALARGVKPLPVRLALAGARYTLKDFGGAAGELEQAVGLAPSDPAIPLSLALVYTELKEATKACEQFLEALKTAGVSGAGAGASGPIVLPNPYVSLPPRFDLTRLLRATYSKALSTNPDDASAQALKTLAESSSFVVGQS